jgi:hypothetical protein
METHRQSGWYHQMLSIAHVLRYGDPWRRGRYGAQADMSERHQLHGGQFVNRAVDTHRSHFGLDNPEVKELALIRKWDADRQKTN